MRPPRPLPRIVTVVSPPESSTQGGRGRLAVAAHLPRDPGHHARDLARLALDRVAEDERRDAGAARDLAAARSDVCGVAIIRISLRDSRGSPGFGVSSRARCKMRATAAGGGSTPYFARMARASAKVVGSATVGPEAMTAGSSPGTSEIISVATARRDRPRRRAGRP